MTAQPLSDPMCALAAGLLILAPLAIAGLALINAGLGRSRSAAQSLVGCLAIFSVAVVAFAILGSVFAAPGGATFTAAGKPWNLIGAGQWLLGSFAGATTERQLQMLFECLAVALVGLIPWGAGADRLRLAAGIAAAVLTRGIHLSALRALDMGRRMAGGAGRQLRPRRRIPRCRRRGLGPRPGRDQRAGPGLDHRPAQGKVSQGGTGYGHARPSRHVCALRLPAGAGRAGWRGTAPGPSSGCMPRPPHWPSWP